MSSKLPVVVCTSLSHLSYSLYRGNDTYFPVTIDGQRFHPNYFVDISICQTPFFLPGMNAKATALQALVTRLSDNHGSAVSMDPARPPLSPSPSPGKAAEAVASSVAQKQEATQPASSPVSGAGFRHTPQGGASAGEKGSAVNAAPAADKVSIMAGELWQSKTPPFFVAASRGGRMTSKT